MTFSGQVAFMTYNKVSAVVPDAIKKDEKLQ